jgi:hypothetical protein
VKVPPRPGNPGIPYWQGGSSAQTHPVPVHRQLAWHPLKYEHTSPCSGHAAFAAGSPGGHGPESKMPVSGGPASGGPASAHSPG